MLSLGLCLRSIIGLLFGHLPPLTCYQSFVLIRAWANAWTTSHRCHERIFQTCICGCSARALASDGFDLHERENGSSDSDDKDASSSSSSSCSSSSSSQTSAQDLPLRAASVLTSRVNMDTLDHYIRCKVLWGTLDLVLFKMRYNVAYKKVPDDPFERICLSNN